MMKTARCGILLGLLTAVAPVCRADDLNWGSLFMKGAVVSPQTAKYLAGIISDTRSNSGIHFTAVAKIISEGHLPTDPGVRESREALQNIPIILKLAVCARTAGDPAQKAACRAAARTGLMVWANTYRPNGDPVNESAFIPWAQAMDAMAPLLEPKDQAQLKKFARAIIAAGDRFYGTMWPWDGRYHNNWASWRLCERAFMAAAVGDRGALQATGKMLDEHLKHNILDDGSTIDFHQRDALHYHDYDVAPLADMAARMPRGFLSNGSRARIQNALNFMRPYFTGQKQHIEFVHTTVPFDIARKKAGLKDYQNLPWDPAGSRKTLRLARVPFPVIRSWTASTVDEHYDPLFKLMVSALEDRP